MKTSVHKDDRVVITGMAINTPLGDTLDGHLAEATPVWGAFVVTTGSRPTVA